MSNINYTQESGTFTVNGEPVDLLINLSPIYTLTINTIPSDALVRVYYNSKWNDGNVHSLFNGEYIYKVLKDGYVTVEDTIIIEDDNKELNINLTLDSMVNVKFIVDDYDGDIDRIAVYKYTDSTNKSYINSTDNWEIKLENDVKYRYDVEINSSSGFIRTDMGPVFTVDNNLEILVKKCTVEMIIPITLFYNKINVYSNQFSSMWDVYNTYESGIKYIEFKTLYMNKINYTIYDNDNSILYSDDVIIESNITINIGEDTYNLTIIPNIYNTDIKLGKASKSNIEYSLDHWIEIPESTTVDIESNNTYRYVVNKDGYKINCGVISNISKDTSINVPLNQLETFKYITTDKKHDAGAAIKQNGALVYWDTDSYNTITDNNYIKVVCSNRIYIALTENGSIITWGNDPDGIILDNKPTGIGYKDIDITSFNNGNMLAIAIDSNGNPILWGDLTDPQNNEMNQNKITGFNLKTISINGCCVGLTENGEVVGWGSDGNYKVGALNHIPSGAGYKKAISYSNTNIYLLSADGKIICIDSNDINNDLVPTGTGYKDICVSNYINMALKSDNKLELFGGNQSDTYHFMPSNENLEYLQYEYDMISVSLYNFIGIEQNTKTLFTFSSNFGKSPATAQLAMSADGNSNININKFANFQYE